MMQAARALPAERFPDVPLTPAVAPYVRAIGGEATVKVLMTFGGAKLYLAADPKARSQLADLIGRDAAIALASALGPGHVHVPTGKPWLARVFDAQGWTVSDIARKLHTSQVTVRKYIRDNVDPRQLRLM